MTKLQFFMLTGMWPCQTGCWMQMEALHYLVSDLCLVMPKENDHKPCS